jgi:phage-related protein
MIEHFNIVFLREVEVFLTSLDVKARNKIVFNIDKARIMLDSNLFKKLNDDIWEFRTTFQSNDYRLLAFWDKTDNQNTLVICTHGFIKKSQKTPKSEIQKALKIRLEYYKG